MDRRHKTELSERERQLVQLAAAGHTDSSIATKLGISEATVNTYWARVRVKVGPFSRPELIATLIRGELNDIIADLRERNKDLTDELQKASGKEAGDPGADYYRKLLMQAPDAMLVVDDKGIVESVNEELVHLFGYPIDEIEGQVLHLLLPDRYKTIHQRHREAYMTQPERRKMADHSVSMGMRKDGTEFAIAATLSPVETVAGTRVVCIVRAVERY